MKTILVTGANGFIGRHMIRALSILEGIKVYPVDSSFGDISQYQTWSRFPPAHILVHLAAKSSVPLSWKSPFNFVETNCLGATLALQYCHLHRAKLIFLSSYMYGDAGSNPISENSTVSVKNPYALTKLFSEQLCDIYQQTYNIDSRIIRPFNVYGPQQGESFLIPKILKEALSLGLVHVKDLEPCRDFIYIDDLVSLVIKVIYYNGRHKVFNAGSGQSHSVHAVIKLVQKLLGRHIKVVDEGIRREGEIMHTVANIDLAKNELLWQPKFTLSEGLQIMIDQL